jgi:hypothetical protein
MNNKQVVFFLLIAVAIVFTGYISWKISTKLGINPWIVKVSGGIVITLLLWLMYGQLKVCPQTKEKFKFALTPAKACGSNLSPYMWSSASPERQAQCNEILDSGADIYSCGTPVMVGLNYIGPDFPQISDDKWKNEYCDNCAADLFYSREHNKFLGRPPVL